MNTVPNCVWTHEIDSKRTLRIIFCEDPVPPLKPRFIATLNNVPVHSHESFWVVADWVKSEWLPLSAPAIRLMGNSH
jgi:hypothetical protein